MLAPHTYCPSICEPSDCPPMSHTCTVTDLSRTRNGFS